MKIISTWRQICAGGKDAATCKGDGGGPLVNKGNGGRWYLIGIASYGYGCGQMATVYTKTSAYRDWITESLRKN